MKLHGELTEVTYKRVPSTISAEVLKWARDYYHVADGQLSQRVSAEAYLECGEIIPKGALIIFKPLFYSLKAQFATLNRTASLHLLAKRTAKSSGKMTGASR